jgi:hypothetical protein
VRDYAHVAYSVFSVHVLQYFRCLSELGHSGFSLRLPFPIYVQLLSFRAEPERGAEMSGEAAFGFYSAPIVQLSVLVVMLKQVESHQLLSESASHNV